MTADSRTLPDTVTGRARIVTQATLARTLQALLSSYIRIRVFLQQAVVVFLVAAAALVAGLLVYFGASSWTVGLGVLIGALALSPPLILFVILRLSRGITELRARADELVAAGKDELGAAVGAVREVRDTGVLRSLVRVVKSAWKIYANSGELRAALGEGAVVLRLANPFVAVLMVGSVLLGSVVVLSAGILWLAILF